MLDPAFASFVGMYPTPLRHGMTVGELARLYNTRFGIGATLHVVPVDGWRRDMTLDATGLRYIPPSPNLRRLEAAVLYPGTVLLEGTNLSEGRGTEMPFEQTGAPWLRPDDVIREMNALALPGVRYEAVSIPVAADGRRFPNTTIRAFGSSSPIGRRTARCGRRSLPTFDTIIGSTLTSSPGPARISASRHAYRGPARGYDRFRTAVDAGTLRPLLEEWDRQADAFRAVREPFLLYR